MVIFLSTFFTFNYFSHIISLYNYNDLFFHDIFFCNYRLGYIFLFYNNKLRRNEKFFNGILTVEGI